MGMWAFAPWDNDEAADWYGEFMEATHFHREWLKGMKADPAESAGTVRAAAAIFLMLGRVYVWPIDTFDQDLELAIRGLAAAANSPEYQESAELQAAIALELAELESRRKPAGNQIAKPSTPERSWWKFW
ncbi:hypothetical protein [Rhodanobacter sp. L36]|uniref:hypothetical protein n=1 Tax=Rhodanobacter sp. L36 TaxID=1747221 RepID=UPI00131DBC84|nr:hypothetical protein [Rhodanobacter sp. L36]